MANDYGAPSDVMVADVPAPTPGPDQVLVRMEAAALNPFDVKVVTGAVRDVVPVQFPYIVGMDGAGTVAGVGTEVQGFEEGDAVFGFFGRTPGTIAEYAVIEDGPNLARRPPDLDPVHAAAIPESGLTAKSLLRAAGVAAGQTMLVVGATGGIGMFAVPLAEAEGVEVVGTATSGDLSYVRKLGAVHAVDYTSTDVAEETLRLYPQGVDAVIDLVNHGEAVRASARAVRAGGRLVSSLFGPADLGRDVTAAYVSLAVEPGDLDDLGARAASRSLHIEVARTYRLDEAPQAVVDFATKHTRGKLVVGL